MKKIIIFSLLISILLALPINAGSRGKKYPNGDVAFVEEGTITIDGIKDAAYADGATFVSNTYRNGFVSTNGTSNTNYLLWDGTYLYIFSEVKDTTLRYASLTKYLTAPHDTECIEYFIVWDNSDCPEVVTFQPYSSPSLYQYRVSHESFGYGGWFESAGSYYAGFANGAENTNPFSTREGEIAEGRMIPTASGYDVELKITMPKSNRVGDGNYEYGDGWKIGFITQQLDWTLTCGNYDGLSVVVSEVGTPAGSVMINKSTAWDCAYYDYVELVGKPVTEEVPSVIEVSEAIGRAGETVTVTVDMKNNPGFGGMAYDVEYDNNVLELVSYDLGLGSTICTDSGIGRYENKVNFQYGGISNVNGDGTLVTLNFKIKDDAAEGKTEIKVIPEDGTFFKYDGRTEVDIDVSCVNGGVEIVNYIKGDINGDGKVNNRDAVRLMQYLAGWEVECVVPALDANGDGRVNNRDAVRIMQYLAGWEVELY